MSLKYEPSSEPLQVYLLRIPTVYHLAMDDVHRELSDTRVSEPQIVIQESMSDTRVYEPQIAE